MFNFVFMDLQYRRYIPTQIVVFVFAAYCTLYEVSAGAFSKISSVLTTEESDTFGACMGEFVESVIALVVGSDDW